MADEPSFHEEFADADNEDSGDFAELNQRISDLEEENSKIVRENKEFKQRLEDLKASVAKLSAENAELKDQAESAQSESKALGAVAARAADLEGEVSRLHHDLATAMSDLQELKHELEAAKGRQKDREVRLEAAEREKVLLGLDLRARDKEIQGFKENVEELEVMIRKLECRGINGDDGFVNGAKRGLIGGLRQREWMLVGGTAVATAAVMGCFIHAARKH